VKVSVDEVERMVRTLPGLAGVIVVGVADDSWGEVPVVVAEEVQPGGATQRAPLADIRDAVGAALGKAARPARVVTVEEIPLLPSGKPDRLTLRRLAAG
jgi:O-succinylbenzoic acid--CoA ligase